MFESCLGTTPYANRVAQERLFLCLKSPISVQYIGLPEKQFSILHFVVDGPKFALAGKLHRPHYVGRVVSLCYLNVLTMWLR